MALQWSQVSGVADPQQTAFVDVLALKPWGQSGEEAFQLTGRIQVSDLSGNWTASTQLGELAAVKTALEAAGWEQITFTTVQEVTRTVIETSA